MFNHDWLKEVYAINSEEKWRALVGDHPNDRFTQGDSHAYLIPTLCQFGKRIDYPVTLNCEQVVEGERSAAIGACHTLVFGTGGSINISKRSVQPNNTVRVLIHELTHALGARGSFMPDDECTAEGTTFQVCRELGLDTSDFSFPYIANYYYPHCGILDIQEVDHYTNRILTEIR